MTTTSPPISLSDLQSKSKDELIKIIQQMQQNTSASSQKPNISTTNQQKSRKKKKDKTLDWSTIPQKKIALQYSYLGHKYSGNAYQGDNDNTVEHYLIQALLKCKLMDPHLEELNGEKQQIDWNKYFSRSGRTDKGVSAMRNVICFTLRYAPNMNYMHILNKSLPRDIRVVGYTEVDSSFDARFSCLARRYKYFFVKRKKNVQKMQEAARYLLGEHDFRNFCKLNVAETVNFTRSVLYCNVQRAECSVELKVPNEILADDGDAEVWEIEICGRSFLYHMVRSISSVLFLVGEGKEEPEIVRDLLDIEKYPSRPQYLIASEVPLLFYDCMYEDMQWNRGMFEGDAVGGCKAMSTLENDTREQLDTLLIRTAMLNTMYHLGVQNTPVPRFTPQEVAEVQKTTGKKSKKKKGIKKDQNEEDHMDVDQSEEPVTQPTPPYHTRLSLWSQVKKEPHIPSITRLHHKPIAEMPRVNTVEMELQRVEEKRKRKEMKAGR